MLSIQGNLYDLWEIRSIEKNEEYNDEKEQIVYLIILNRNGLAVNFTEVKFEYDTLEERDADMLRIKSVFDDNEDILII